MAVLLTHGHLDHTFSVTPVCGARGIPLTWTGFVHTDNNPAGTQRWLSWDSFYPVVFRLDVAKLAKH